MYVITYQSLFLGAKYTGLNFNGMIFYNPIFSIFCTSTDYMIDKNCYIIQVFPGFFYDLGLKTSVISKHKDNRTKFNIEKSSFVQDQTIYNIFEATIVVPLISRSKFYTIKLTKYSTLFSDKPSIKMGFFCPDWLKHDQKVTLLHDNVYHKEYLNLNNDNLLEFFSHDANRNITLQADISDL